MKEKEVLALARKMMIKRLKKGGTKEIGISISLIGGYLFYQYVKEAKRELHKKGKV